MRAKGLILPLFFQLLCACSLIEYSSSGKIPVYFTHRQDHQGEFRLEGRESFYFFGQVPDKRVVLLDEMLLEQGFAEASKVQIHEQLTFSDMLLSLLALGMYTPRSYVITGRGLRE